ncbi:MAG: M20/M25/M40 family metallo-hydrolase [Planctomycetes bacterium]|nr:M20/M25/M40 family metallo-hydrolase [Planctomycetota bacterium]
MDVVELTRALVRIPSVSGSEQGCIALLRETIQGATVLGRNLYAVRGSGEDTLLLNSHMDTVPASAEWTIDPHGAEVREGKVKGLGANDAKGPLAALVCAFLRAKVPSSGRLLLAATCDEETGGEGLGTLLPALPRVSASIIGEPTALEVCSCQRGLLRLRLIARGKRAHAARPWQGENAIEKAARDVVRLAQLPLPVHPLLGPATVQATMIKGGVRTNVVPPECTIEVDARTIPELDNRALYDRVRAIAECEVDLVSERIAPVETEPHARIVQSALAAAGQAVPRAFGGVSDLFHVRAAPGVVLGPGRSEQSHAADEWIETDQLRRGVEIYVATIERYFEGAPGA